MPRTEDEMLTLTKTEITHDLDEEWTATRDRLRRKYGSLADDVITLYLRNQKLEAENEIAQVRGFMQGVITISVLAGIVIAAYIAVAF